MRVSVEDHPLLDLRIIFCVFQRGLSAESDASIQRFFDPNASAPIRPSESAKTLIRDLLRVGGFKPSGRSKPASEYLIKAAEGGFLGPINPAVDVCNAVSLHSGLPISVVDLDRLTGDLSIRIAEAGTRYIFNASGQEIDVSGLLCLHDEQSACANAVKDSQRTKTDEETTRCLYLFWGSRELSGVVDAAAAWTLALLRDQGAEEIAEINAVSNR